MRSRITIALVAVLTATLILITGCGPNPAPNGNNANLAKGNTESKPTETRTPSTPPTTPAPPVCSTGADAQIVAEFRAALQNNTMLQGQRRHINYFSNSCVLTLQGWTNDAASYSEALKLARAVTNVQEIMVGKFYDSPNNPLPKPPAGQPCDSGYFKCGDFCVANGTVCAIVDPGTVPGLTPSTTPTPR